MEKKLKTKTEREGDLPQLLFYYLTYQWEKMLCDQKEVLKSFFPV